MTRRPIGVKAILLAMAAALTFSLSACGDDDSTPTAADDPAALSLDDLDGRVFASVQVDGRKLIDDTQIRLGFDGTDLSAEAGCNHLFGAAAIDGGTLTVTNMGGTEMGCPDGRAEQDAWLTEFLGAGATAVLSDATLTLTGDDVVLELEEQDVPDQSSGDPDEPTSN